MKNIFIQNFPMKLLSLLLAMVTWMYVNLITDPVVTRDMKIGVLVTGKKEGNNFILRGIPENVILTLSGGRKDVLRFLHTSEPVAVLNLRDISTGKFSRKLEVTLPGGLRVVSISPAEVNGELIELMEREMKVSLAVEGTPRETYYLESATLENKVVRVKAPAEIASKIEKAIARVSIDGFDSQKKVKTRIEALPDFSSPDVSIIPQETVAMLDIRKCPTKTVEVEPVVKGTPAAGYYLKGVRTEPSTVLAIGPPKILAGLKKIRTHALNIDGAKTGISQSITLEKVESPVVLEVKEVKIVVEIAEERVTKKFSGVTVRPKGLPDEYEVRLSPEKITLVLEGPANLLNTLSRDSLEVFVSLEGSGPGRMKKEVLFDLIPGVEMLPESVVVDIRRKE